MKTHLRKRMLLLGIVLGSTLMLSASSVASAGGLPCGLSA